MTMIACIGHAAFDTIFRVPSIPATPTKVLATGYLESGGGMAANASVAAARLGGTAHYWGRVGNDALGGKILAQLTTEGVNVDVVQRFDGCISPTTAVLVADDGARLICTYNDPAIDQDPSWLPLHAMRRFDVVLADVRWPRGAAAVLDAAREAGVPTVLDGDVGDVDAIRDLSRRADYVIFSDAGLTLATAGGDPGTGLRKAQELTRGIVGVTVGRDGFLWLEDGRERRMPAPEVTAIDTLAAGDVFHGAFALCIGEGETVADAARFANAAAALKCTRFGGRLGAPNRAEVEALLLENR
jgi:sulfofructose kinase